MALKKLSDKDGKLQKPSFGTEIIGDGTTAIPSDGWYLVTSVATSGTALLGGQVGYVAYLTTSITPAVGDDVKPVTLEDMCFVQNASVDLAKDELEATTLCDDQKVFEAGRGDNSGSFDGLAYAGSPSFREIQNKFLPVLVQDAGTITITESNSDVYYLFLETSKGDVASGVPQQAYLMPVQILTSNAGVSNGSMQTFSATFRITKDEVNNVEPVMIERTL